MPKSLLVIGSGAIGIEFASFYRNAGRRGDRGRSADRILPVEDEEISAFARKAFEKQGMKISPAPR
jgi:dihydrolipoamide dehydrogenase